MSPMHILKNRWMLTVVLILFVIFLWRRDLKSADESINNVLGEETAVQAPQLNFDMRPQQIMGTIQKKSGDVIYILADDNQLYRSFEVGFFSDLAEFDSVFILAEQLSSLTEPEVVDYTTVVTSEIQGITNVKKIEEQVIDEVQGWPTYQHPNAHFSVKHPTQMVVSSGNTRGFTRLLFLGSLQESDEEDVIDGIDINLAVHLLQDQSLESYVEGVYSNMSISYPVTKQKEKVEIAGKTGYSYSLLLYTEVEYIFLEWGDGSYLEIIKVVADPTDSGYKVIANDVINSLKK